MKVTNSLSCLVLFCYFLKVYAFENNVCKTYMDYYSMKDNPRCFYDFTVNSSVPDTIKGYGYPVEIHSLTNKDGYVLTLFRLPNKNALVNKKESIYLQHGLYASSGDFFGHNNDSIGFVLFNAGYDVWFGNTRGSEYSNKHINFTVKDTEYWNYSLDDISLVDLPAIFEYMSIETGQEGNIVYVGHSLGTSLALMYSSGMPEHAKRMLKFMFLLAPAYTLPNMISPVKVLGPFGPKILSFVYKANLVTLASDGKSQRELLGDICFADPLLLKSCMDSINLFYGPYTEMTADRVPYFFRHFPSGISVKALEHSSIFILNKFTKYDHGSVENMKLYGSPEPPAYNISEVDIPVHIITAKNDWACTAKDAKNLYYKLPPKVRSGFDLITLQRFNHVDFLFGKDAVNLVYNRIVKIMQSFNNKENKL